MESVATEQVTLKERVAARRARFRDAVERLAERAQSTELLRMLLAPAAFALLAGFVFMFLGWYGASRTHREIEQVPYLISGAIVGLGLVFVGGLLLASAFWMSMLQRFHEQSEERAQRQMEEFVSRLREEAASPAPKTRPVRSPRARVPRSR